MTHAQGKILETAQTDITRTDIEIALDSLQSLTSVRQTLFSYLSNQKVLGKEKKSLEYTIENLKDEKRQLELDVDKLKKELNDTSIEYGMKQKELLNWMDKAPYIPPSSPVLAPNDSKQDFDKSVHESDNAPRPKQTTPDKFTEDIETSVNTRTASNFAEEINKDRPSTPSPTEKLMLNNNGYVLGKVTPCLDLHPCDERTQNLESSFEKENEKLLRSKEVGESDRHLTPSPTSTFRFNRNVAHNKNECELSKATPCLDLLPRDPTIQSLESSFEKEPEELTCSKEVGEMNRPSTLCTCTSTEDLEQNNDEQTLNKATTSSDLLPCDDTKQCVMDLIVGEEESEESTCPKERETDRHPTPSSPSTFKSTEDIAQNNDEQVLNKATTSSDLLPCDNPKQSFLQLEEESEESTCTKEAPSTFTSTDFDEQVSNKADLCDDATHTASGTGLVEEDDEESTCLKEENETYKDRASAPSPTTSPTEKLMPNNNDPGLGLRKCDDTIQTGLGFTSVEEENEELFCPKDTDNTVSLLTKVSVTAAAAEEEEEENKGEINKEKVPTDVDHSSAYENSVRNIDSMSSEDTDDRVPFLTQASAATTEDNKGESKGKISLSHNNTGENAYPMSTEGIDDLVPFLTQVSAASETATVIANATETEENNEGGKNKEKFGTIIDFPSIYNSTEPNANSMSSEEDPSLQCEEEEELNMHRWEEASTKSNVVTPFSKKRRYSYANHWSPKKWRRMTRSHRLQSIFFDNIH